MKYFLYDHSGCVNRGCEAIVRSTVDIIKSADAEARFGLCSFMPETDGPVKDLMNEIVCCQPEKMTPAQSLLNKVSFHIRHNDDYYYKASFAHVVREAERYDVCLLVGGDTFCYGDNILCRRLTEAFLRLGKKVYGWGMSVGKEDLTDEKLRTLKSLDGVFVRESLSFETLKDAGVDRAWLFPDPAFNLKTAQVSLPEGAEGRLFGINISPLAKMKAAGIPEKLGYLLRYLETETDFTPLLIPHVTDEANNNSDWACMNDVMKKCGSKKAILLPGNLTAPEYKGYVSQCYAFIGARTHSIVAAYSSCVPAFALGYSVKARGMAKDIFGGLDYIRDVTAIEGDEGLIDCAKILLRDRDLIKSRLDSVIPSTIATSHSAGEKLISERSGQ